LATVDFVAWSGAYNDLGEKFYKYFNPVNGIYRAKYHENPSQRDDVKKFFEGKYSAILIDKNIFKWYKRVFNNKNLYDYHKIFPKRTGFSIAFRSYKLRNLFNQGLSKIKRDGTYKKIVQYNRTHNFYPLLDDISLIASISSKYLYNLQADKLKRVLKKFLLDDNILSIEIIDTKLNKRFLKVSKKYLEQPTDTIETKIDYKTEQDILHLGKVIITYKKEFDFSKSSPIPDVSLFNKLPKDELDRIRDIYDEYGYLRVKKVLLTKKEREYLKRKGLIRVHNEKSWAPYNFNENGVPKGFVIDYINLLAQKLNANIEFVSGYTWNQFLKLAI